MRCRGLTYEINQIYKLYSILFYPRRRVGGACPRRLEYSQHLRACSLQAIRLSLLSLECEWTGECLESAHVVPTGTGSPLVCRRGR